MSDRTTGRRRPTKERGQCTTPVAFRRLGIRDASPYALDVFVHCIAGAIATMAAAYCAIDVLALTRGIGKNATDVRVVVSAREELVIAAETRRLLQG